MRNLFLTYVWAFFIGFLFLVLRLSLIQHRLALKYRAENDLTPRSSCLSLKGVGIKDVLPCMTRHLFFFFKFLQSFIFNTRLFFQVSIKCYLTGYNGTLLQCLQEAKARWLLKMLTSFRLLQSRLPKAQRSYATVSLTACNYGIALHASLSSPLRSTQCKLPASRNHVGCFLHRKANSL